MELGAREFFYMIGVSNSGPFYIVIYFDLDDGICKTYTGNFFPTLLMARSEASAVARDGIIDERHGEVPPDRIKAIHIASRNRENSNGKQPRPT